MTTAFVQRAKDDRATENSNRENAVRPPHDIPAGVPASLISLSVDATSHRLGWVGLQAVRYRDLATNEIHMPALSQHLLILHTKPPAEGNFRYEGIKREVPPPVGSITVMPVGSVVECRWRGTKDALHIYLDPKLIARVATTGFELDLSRKGILPFDALSVPELRTTMLAIGAELTADQFLIRRRVERAQQLLCGREEVSLAEVAIRAGFSDQSQLC